MGTTPEGRVVNKLKKMLKEFENIYIMKPVQRLGSNLVLDFHCVHNGIPFAVEAKAEGKKPTPRQCITIGMLEKAGCKCFVVDGDESIEEVKKWLQNL